MQRALSLTGTVLLVTCLAQAPEASAIPYEQRSPATQALYASLAVIANVTPLVSTLYAPRCLPGYVACKIFFAGVSLIAAADQLILSGAGDLGQTRAIVYRGFSGDWYLTGRHTAGDARPEPLPDPPPPPAGSGQETWEPPPR